MSNPNRDANSQGSIPTMLLTRRKACESPGVCCIQLMPHTSDRVTLLTKSEIDATGFAYRCSLRAAFPIHFAQVGIKFRTTLK